MNAPPGNAAAIVAAAKHPDLVAIEKQLVDARASHAAALTDLREAREAADPQFTRYGETKNGITMGVAATRAANIERTVSAIEKTIADLTTKAEALRPSSTAAVVDALAPLRRQAANDIAVSARTLYDAIARFNATTEAMERNGATGVISIPANFPIVDHFVQKIAADAR